MYHFPATIICRTSSIPDGNMSFRVGDTNNVLHNRKKFLRDNDIDFKNHICMKCDHGEQITPIDWSTRKQYFGSKTQENMLLSEVLVTQEKGLALMLLTADCLPVSFYDPVTHTIALAHFSRETISKLLPQKTILFLQEQYAINPGNILVSIGPYIHTHAYTFSTTDNIQENILPFTQAVTDHFQIDILGACKEQLTLCAVPHTNIFTSPIDTSTSTEHFSHHASKTKNKPDGRQATILMRRKQ